MISLWVAATVCLTAPLADPPKLGTKKPYPPMQPPFHDLVRDGEAVSCIVLQPGCTEVETFAAEELTRYLEQISGAQVAAGTEPEPDRFPIYLGAAGKEVVAHVDSAELGTQGFVIRSSPAGLVIAGGSDLGTLYGVYQFLEKYLGVRWFMPGEIGTVVPESRSVAIGTIEDSDRPDFRVRWVESGEWALHNKTNVSVEVREEPVGVKWLWGFHSHLRLVPPDEHFDEHPEYFALIKGRRRRPAARLHSYQLCTTNPEVINLLAENVCRRFEQDPDLDIISVTPMDGGGFCTCAECLALDEDRPEEQRWHAQYSSRLAVFNNAVARLVAERHPDRLLKVGAYAMYMRAPLDPDYRPEPNLVVEACHTYACNNHRIGMPTCERNWNYYTRDLERWAEIAEHLFIYEYYNKGAWGGLPYPQIHVIKWDIPYFRDLGVEGFYTQAAGRRFPVVGLNHYIATKLTWDADLDVRELLEDFYGKFYQEAGEPMGRYWDRLEQAFEDSPEHISPFGYKWTTLAAPHFFTPEVLADLAEAIGEAERLAQSEVVKQRVHLCRVTLDFTTMVMDYLKAIQRPFVGVDRDDEAAVQAAHREAIRIGEPMSNRIVEFCERNGVPVYDRLVKAHNTLRLITPAPEDEGAGA
jgi:hypothetical protein